MTGRRGFTLIEVVVVMALVAIAIGLVGPRIGAGLDRLQMNNAAQTARGLIRLARLQAERTEKSQYVIFDRNRRVVSLVNDQMKFIRESELPSSIDIVLENGARTAALFVTPSGIVRGAIVRFRSGSHEVVLP
jgi:prepilin-type N-terminal cleavage/methylation domain-containing protein